MMTGATPLIGGTQALKLNPLEAEAKEGVAGLSPTFCTLRVGPDTLS